MHTTNMVFPVAKSSSPLGNNIMEFYFGGGKMLMLDYAAFIAGYIVLSSISLHGC